MTPLISISLLLLNLPVFGVIKQQLFPEQELWQQAISLAHPPEMTQVILSGDWRELSKHLRLAFFTSVCAAVYLAQHYLLSWVFTQQ